MSPFRAFVAPKIKPFVEEVKPEADQPKISAIDGRMYKAQGPKWHKSDRQKDLVPVGLRNVDTESKWSKSGYRGWVQGYRLVVQGVAFPEPVPIFAAWRPNNEAVSRITARASLWPVSKIIWVAPDGAFQVVDGNQV